MIVPGDVNSTLAATLVAAKLGVPLAHLEAGLRSFDRTMPEEINRIVADEFSDYLFIHSDEASENLRAEGIAPERIHFVGNTMIDTLVAMEERFRGLGAAARYGLTARRLPARHAAPAGARGRPVLFDVLDAVERASRASCRSCSRLTRAPASGWIEIALGPAVSAARPGRLSRVPVAAGRCRRGADRLRRRPGGDHVPGGPVLHAARQHRAPGDGAAPAPTRCSGSIRLESPTSCPRSRARNGAAHRRRRVGRPRRGAGRRGDLPRRVGAAPTLVAAASGLKAGA